jgi:hypothetical protein
MPSSWIVDTTWEKFTETLNKPNFLEWMTCPLVVLGVFAVFVAAQSIPIKISSLQQLKNSLPLLRNTTYMFSALRVNESLALVGVADGNTMLQCDGGTCFSIENNVSFSLSNVRVVGRSLSTAVVAVANGKTAASVSLSDVVCESCANALLVSIAGAVDTVALDRITLTASVMSLVNVQRTGVVESLTLTGVSASCLVQCILLDGSLSGSRTKAVSSVAIVDASLLSPFNAVELVGTATDTRSFASFSCTRCVIRSRLELKSVQRVTLEDLTLNDGAQVRVYHNVSMSATRGWCNMSRDEASPAFLVEDVAGATIEIRDFVCGDALRKRGGVLRLNRPLSLQMSVVTLTLRNVSATVSSPVVHAEWCVSMRNSVIDGIVWSGGQLLRNDADGCAPTVDLTVRNVAVSGASPGTAMISVRDHANLTVAHAIVSNFQGDVFLELLGTVTAARVSDVTVTASKLEDVVRAYFVVPASSGVYIQRVTVTNSSIDRVVISRVANAVTGDVLMRNSVVRLIAFDLASANVTLNNVTAVTVTSAQHFLQVDSAESTVDNVRFINTTCALHCMFFYVRLPDPSRVSKVLFENTRAVGKLVWWDGSSGSSVVASDIELRNSTAGDACLQVNALQTVSISGVRAFGGATKQVLYLDTAGSVRISSVTIDNTVRGIQFENAKNLTLTDVTIRNMRPDCNDRLAPIAVTCTSSSQVTMTNVAVVGNNYSCGGAAGAAGAVILAGCTTATATRLWLEGNTGQQSGALAASAMQLSISDSLIRGNVAPQAACLLLRGGAATLSGMRFVDNVALGSTTAAAGGCVHSTSTSLTVIQSLFRNNTALSMVSSASAALAASGSPLLFLDGVDFDDNTLVVSEANPMSVNGALSVINVVNATLANVSVRSTRSFALNSPSSSGAVTIVASTGQSTNIADVCACNNSLMRIATPTQTALTAERWFTQNWLAKQTLSNTSESDFGCSAASAVRASAIVANGVSNRCSLAVSSCSNACAVRAPALLIKATAAPTPTPAPTLSSPNAPLSTTASQSSTGPLPNPPLSKTASPPSTGPLLATSLADFSTPTSGGFIDMSVTNMVESDGDGLPIGPIVGGVVGGCCVLTSIAVVIVLAKQYSAKKANKSRDLDDDGGTGMAEATAASGSDAIYGSSQIYAATEKGIVYDSSMPAAAANAKNQSGIVYESSMSAHMPAIEYGTLAEGATLYESMPQID